MKYTTKQFIAKLFKENPHIKKFSPELLPKSYMNVDIAMETLVEITDVFDLHQQNYRVVFGTLLGLHRDGRLIQHDKDIDIAFDYDDTANLYDSIKTLESLGYTILRLEDSMMSLGCRRGSCYIDLYFYKYMRPGRLGITDYALSPDDFTADTTLDCNGKKVKTVEDPEFFCRKYYGICWRTPTKGAPAKPHQVGQSRSQYGEDEFFYEYFGNKAGFVVDVGAADGIVNSNSCNLILDRKWSGILIEPHLTYFGHACKLHGDNDNVIVLNNAVWTEECDKDFHIFAKGYNGAQVSTCIDAFKTRVIKQQGDHFLPPVKVKCKTLTQILQENNCPKNIDLMDIDCEGADMMALESLDFDIYDVNLFCVEMSGDMAVLDAYMESKGYIQLKRMGGNMLYKRQ